MSAAAVGEAAAAEKEEALEFAIVELARRKSRDEVVVVVMYILRE